MSEYWRVTSEQLRAAGFVEVVTEIERLRAENERMRQAECAKCGRSLPPDGDCYGCQADRLQEELQLTRGAMAADDERLRAAAAKAGVTDFGCDTADHLADRILELQAVVDLVFVQMSGPSERLRARRYHP